MKSKTLILTLAMLLGSTPFAFATPQTASMATGVYVSYSPLPPVLSTDSDSWAGSPTGLSVSATAEAVDLNGDVSVHANFEGSSAFASDGNSGSMQMNYGWGGTGNSVDTGILTNWSYTFTADADGLFQLDYHVAGSGELFGLWGFDLSHDFDSGVGAPISSPYDPTANGTFIGALTAGQTYTVSLANNGNLGYDSGVNANFAEASVSSRFSWFIDYSHSVPDNGATLTLFGLALAGLVGLRRKL